MTDRVAVELTIAAPADVVWRALREPAELRRWFGWEYDGLEPEIEEIFLSDTACASASQADGVLDTGGGRFELESRGDATVVRVVMPGSDAEDALAGTYDAIEQGWITFVQQLRFALERHRGEDRRTLHLDGGPADAVARLERGELGAPPGEPWFRTEHQLGLSVAEWGDGLAIVAEAPRGASAVLTTYGLDDAELAALRERWTAAWRPPAG